MRGNKELPTYQVLLRMCAKREEQFNPMEYLHGSCEKDFLEERPHLRTLCKI